MHQVELLDNNDLDILCKKLKLPITKICRVEDLKNLSYKSKYGYFIINYDNQHWVCFYIKDKFCVYCDSYGEAPSNIILHFFKRNKIKYTINYQQSQHLYATSCGWFCIAFLYFMFCNKNNKNLSYVISMFNERFNADNQNQNDNKLRDYIKSIF